MFHGGYAFGSWPPSGENYKDFHIRSYFGNPEKLDDKKRIVDYDKSAAETIEECRKAIETLTAYRIALAERYNEIATTPTVPVVKLTREHGYYRDTKVYYYLRTYSRNVNTGKEIETSSTAYNGTERHQAIKDFESYIKAHPGIIAEKNIEKSRWEK